jgi:hypothetical protein
MNECGRGMPARISCEDGICRGREPLEGLGKVPLYFVELGELPIEIPPVEEPTFPARIRETIGFGVRAFPRVLGLRQGT